MTIVIGLSDLHSQVKSLDRLREVRAHYPEAITVFMGDYIDTYGENSGFALLERIRAMQAADPQHIVVLRGNHEQAAINFFENPKQTAWLSFGGEATLQAVANSLGGGENVMADRQLIMNQKSELLDWVRQLPLTFTTGKLCFVHAGLDLTLADPIRETTAHDRLWMRANYWYDPHYWGIFGHNPLPVSLITGHTPNGSISGRYADAHRPDKLESDNYAIYAIQYPHEFPRYLMDGGAGGEAPRALGNIGVFDSDTGLLVDAIED